MNFLHFKLIFLHLNYFSYTLKCSFNWFLCRTRREFYVAIMLRSQKSENKPKRKKIKKKLFCSLDEMG